MINWGAIPLGAVLPFMFGSYDGATGASEAIAGLAVTDIECYKGVSMTQRSSDAGYTLLDTDGIDIDGMVGINGFSIDTGDNTDAGFFVAGSYYTVVVASITADGQTVNFVAGTFRLMAAESVAGVPEVDVTHIGGDAQSATDLKDFADAGYDPATNKVQGVVLTDTVTTYTGNTVQTGDSFARLGAPAGASVSADIAAIEAQTDDIGAAGAGLTAVPWNAAWDAEVQSEVADALGAYDPPTRAEATSDKDEVLAVVATVDGNVDAILVDTGTTLDGKLDTIDDFLDTEITDIRNRLPAALVGGRMDASVGAMAAAVITAAAHAASSVDAAALATDAVNEIRDAILAAVIEGAVTLQQSLRLANAANGGKLSGAATTTVLIRDLGDTKDRVDATVDADGNRSAVTLDLS